MPFLNLPLSLPLSFFFLLLTLLLSSLPLSFYSLIFTYFSRTYIYFCHIFSLQSIAFSRYYFSSYKKNLGTSPVFIPLLPLYPPFPPPPPPGLRSCQPGILVGSSHDLRRLFTTSEGVSPPPPPDPENAVYTLYSMYSVYPNVVEERRGRGVAFISPTNGIFKTK